MLFLHSESDCVLVDKVLGRKEGVREGRREGRREGWRDG